MTSIVPGMTAGSTAGSTTVMGISAGQVGRVVGAEPEGEQICFCLNSSNYLT